MVFGYLWFGLHLEGGGRKTGLARTGWKELGGRYSDRPKGPAGGGINGHLTSSSELGRFSAPLLGLERRGGD